MYCKKCGQQLDDHATACYNCGAPTDTKNSQSQPVEGARPTNAVAIVGFVMSFLVPIVGLICSIIGMRKANKEGLGQRKLAIAGLVISIVSMVFNLIIYSLFGDVIYQYIYQIIGSVY